MSNKDTSLLRNIVAGEFIGTFILVFIGCATGALTLLGIIKLNLAQIALIWGAGVALAIYLTRNLSGAHLNPAVTIALMPKHLPFYLFSQVAGAFAAAALLYLMFAGQLESVAKLSGSYDISLSKALVFELIGTAVLVLVIFILSSTGSKKFNPVLIGATVAVLIYFIAPLTQAGLNPARDLGPRLLGYFAGQKQSAITGSQLVVYSLGPILGGLLGAGLHKMHSSLSRT